MTVRGLNTIAQFESGQIDAQTFSHADHVRMAYHLLREYDFVETCSRYIAGNRQQGSNLIWRVVSFYYRIGAASGSEATAKKDRRCHCLVRF